MMKVIEHAQSEISHGEWLLRNRGSNEALLNSIQGVRIGIHRQNNFVLNPIVLQYRGHFLASLSLKTHKRIYLFFFSQYFGRTIKGYTWVVFYIDDLNNLDLGMVFQRIKIPSQTFLQIDLLGHGEHYKISLSLQFLHEPL